MPDVKEKWSTLTIKELKEKRADLVTNSRKLIDTADAEKRDMTTEESRQFDGMSDDIGDISDAIDSKEKDQDRRSRLQDWESNLDKAPDVPRDQPQGHDGARADGKPFELELRDDRIGGKRILEFRKDSPKQEERRLWERGQAQFNVAFRQYLFAGKDGLTSEMRATLQAGDNEGGGYLVPTQFVARLIKFVDDLVFIRQRATVLPMISGDSVGFPSLETDPDDFEWTTELQTGSEDTSMTFGQRELAPHPLAKRIKISNKLMRASALSIEDLVIQRLGYKIGVTEEKAFLTGNGNQRPLGVFTASDQGVSTSRDVSTDNTATSITFDGLKNAKYTLKSQYWPRARWMFHRDAVKQISKLKDGEGQYLWQPSVVVGDPDRLLMFPMDVSEFAPNTFTTGQYVGILCDWSWYWIADSLMMSMQRLVELYAETNQTGFIGRKETDAMPVLEEAFVRVKLA